MEQAGKTVYEQMNRKLDILQKISTNTKIQIQFIHQRKMKGLLRLLRERARYLQELEALTKEFGNASVLATGDEKINEIILLIASKRQEIIKDNNHAIVAASAERDHIAADLQRVESVRKLKKVYDYQWTKFSGNRFNQKR